MVHSHSCNIFDSKDIINVSNILLGEITFFDTKFNCYKPVLYIMLYENIRNIFIWSYYMFWMAFTPQQLLASIKGKNFPMNSKVYIT